MTDQAAHLRALTQTASVVPYDDRARVPTVVVSGAQAGVGTTTVAVNLAAALADSSGRVLVVDAAERRNALAEVAGVGRGFEYSLSDVIAGKCDVADAIVGGPVGMRVLAECRHASSKRGREFRRNSPTVGGSRGAQQKLLSELETLHGEVDFIVVDAGFGLSAWARRFWLRARLVVLVTTPDDASLLDAYAAVKLSSSDAIRPAVQMLVNRAENDRAADSAYRRMQNACQQFLSLSIAALPPLPQHEDETIAGGHRAPRVWEAPNSAFGHGVLWLGRAVAERMQDAGCGEQGPRLKARPEQSLAGIH